MKLIVLEDGLRTELALGGPVISIGRALDNDIRLTNTLVSRHHCRIETLDDEAWVIDLGSANGTLVNGERVDRRVLAPGDEIELSGTRVQVEEEEPATEEPTLVAAVNDGTPVGQRTLSGEARRERENLRVFARITRELVRETDLLPLLRLIVDSAVSLVGGERGFLLLHDPQNGDGQGGQSAGGSQAESGPVAVDELTVRVAPELRPHGHRRAPLPGVDGDRGASPGRWETRAHPRRVLGRALRRHGQRRGPAPALGHVLADPGGRTGRGRPVRRQPPAVRGLQPGRPRAGRAVRSPGIAGDQERPQGRRAQGEEQPPRGVAPADRAAERTARSQGPRPRQRAGRDARRARPGARSLRLHLDRGRVGPDAGDLPAARPDHRVGTCRCSSTARAGRARS